jgi:hypothetical protein
VTELETKQGQLAEVRAAISAVLTRGQRAGMDGADLTRADLLTLRRTERELQSEIAALTRGSGARITRVVFR